MTMRLVPEFLLFCLALRHPQLPEDAEALRRAIMADLDWNCIIAGARHHRLASHVLAGLASVRHRLIPDRVITRSGSTKRSMSPAPRAGAGRRHRPADSVTPLSASARISVPAKARMSRPISSTWARSRIAEATDCWCGAEL